MKQYIEIEHRGETTVFRCLKSFLEKLIGLLGGKKDCSVILYGCKSIHTFGMKFDIDVCFCDSSNTVCASYCKVPPGRILCHRNACCVLERKSCEKSWFEVGEKLLIEERVGVSG